MKFNRNLLAAAALAAASASASAFTLDFGTLLSGTGAPSSLSFATLSVTENGSDVDFSLDAFGLDQFTGTTPFIGAMAVQGNNDNTSVTNVSGGVSSVGMNPGGGPGGSYQFRFVFGQGAGNRLTDGETVSWTWVGGAGKYDGFALHVQGINYDSGTSTNATTSAWYVPGVVPEPETYALMLAGLAGVGLMARRRKSA